jgi:Family of unknown function (DUF6299)
MRLVRCVGLAALVLGTVVATAAPAFAAPPGNDTYAGRTVVESVPFTQTLETGEATTDSDDAQLNAQCGAPATDASVWYELTASAAGGMVVAVSDSSYTAGAIVATGGPGNWTLVNCAPGAVGWTAAAGVTYTILVFDDQFDGGGNGGTLRLTIGEAPPVPTIDVTLDPIGQFHARTGTATVSGTVTCAGVVDFAFLDIELRQNVGRVSTVRGFGFADVTCDGVTRQWTAEIFPDNGKFAGGKAAEATFAVACGAVECGVDFEQRTIMLRG